MPLAPRKRFIFTAVMLYLLIGSLWITVSDHLLALFTDATGLIYFSTLKGLVFVGVTALLLFLILHLEPSWTFTQPPALSGDTPRALRMVLLGVMVITVGVSVLIAYLQVKALKTAALNRLEAVAEMKAQGVTDWLKERRADVRFLAHNSLLQEALAHWRQTQDPDDQAHLSQVLQSARDTYHYGAVQLLSPSGEAWFEDGPVWLTEPCVRDGLAEAVRSRQIKLCDMHRHANDPVLHLVYLMPVLSPATTPVAADAEATVLGVILFSIDPTVYLFPYLQTWPLSSKTGEISLLRREGDHLMHLNPLRFKPDATLNLRVPLTAVKPAPRALRDGQTWIEGLDYRQIEILGAARPILETSWTLLVKQDKTEVFVPIYRLALGVGAMTLVSLLSFIGLIVMIWQRQRLHSTQRELAYLREIQASETLAKQAQVHLRLQGAALNATANAVVITGDDSVIQWANPAFFELTGYNQAEVIGQPMRDLICAGEQSQPFYDQLWQILRAGQTWRGELVSCRKDGSFYDEELVISPVFDEQAQITHFVGVIQDMTERKRLVTDKLASEQRLTLALEGAALGLWDWHVPSGHLTFNAHTAEMLGYTLDELPPNLSVWTQLIHPDDWPVLSHALESHLRGESPHYVCEYRIRHKAGHWVWILDSGRVLARDPQGQAIQVVGVQLDLSQRKQYEEALRSQSAALARSEQHLREAQAIAKIGSWHLDLSNNSLSWSDENYRLFGVAVEPGTALSFEIFLACVHPDDRARVLAAWQAALGGAPYEIEHRILVNQRVYWVKEQAVVRFAEDGHALEAMGTALDITELKQAERALRDSESRLHRVLEHILDVVVLYDRDLRIEYINEATTRLTGRPVSDYLGRRDDEMWPAAVSQVWLPTLREALVTGQVQVLETSLRITDENERHLMLTCIPIVDESGQAQEVIGIAHDFTDRRRAELALQTVTRRQEAILAAVPEIIAEVDKNKAYTWVNQAGYDFFGPDVIGQEAQHFFIGSQNSYGLVEPVLQGGEQVVYIESWQRRQDGEARLLAWWCRKITNLDGQSTGVISSARDITEQQRAKQALIASEARFRTIFNQAGVGIAQVSLDGEWLQINQRLAEMLGYEIAELQGKKFIDFTYAEDLITDQEAIQLFSSNQIQSFRCEKRYHHRLGHLIWARVAVAALRNEAGEAESFITVYEDITEKKTAESRVERLSQMYQALSDTNQMLVRVKERQALFKNICEIILYLNNVCVASITVLDKTTQAPSLQAISYKKTTQREQAGLDKQAWSTQALVMQTIQQHTTQLNNDYQTQTDAVIPDILAVLCLPLCENDQLIGVLSIGVTEKGYFDTEIIHLFEEMAYDITFSLDNLHQASILHRTLETLKESEERLRIATENIRDAFIIIEGETGQVISWNAAAEQIFGWQRAEILGKSLHHLLPTPELREQAQAAVVAFNQTGQGAQVGKTLELQALHKQGHRIEVELSLSAMFMQGHWQAVGIVRDITARKRSEMQLQESEARFRAIVELQEDAVCRWLPDTTLTYANVHYRNLFGIAEDAELINHQWLDFIPELDRAEVRAYCLELAQNPRKVTYEHAIKDKQGQERWVLWVDLPLFDEQGRCTKFQSVGRDITDRKKAEETLRLTNELLEQRVALRTVELNHALRLKDEFLASMSHELRTPLNGILSGAEILEEQIFGEMTPKQLSYLRMIHNSGAHLLTLINDILDLAKIEAGNTELDIGPCAVSEICHASLEMIKGIAHKKQLTLNYVIDPPNLILHADARRIKQVLVNLLSNAVKFTPEQRHIGLTVSADLETGTISLLVWDQGIGIAEQDFSKLFKPFVQLDGGLSRHYEGSGLGLSLVAKIVKLHGGSVTLDSTLGEGSRFTVTLPHVQALATPKTGQTALAALPESPSISPRRKATILLADDNLLIAQIYMDYFQVKGYQVLLAVDGMDVLQKAQESVPDVILMDIQMPGMNGLEAIRQIRHSPIPALAQVPIIAVTVLAMPDDRERCLAAGADAYLPKPIALKQVEERIERLLQEKQAGPNAS